MQSTKQAHIQAQPGSLAAALGMTVDSSSRALPIRVEREAISTPKKSLVDAILSNASQSPTQHNSYHQGLPSQPQPGSLAAALGMQVDANRHAPPVRHGVSPFDAMVPNSTGTLISNDNLQIHKHADFPAQPGSLAAALGMNVDSSSRAPPIRLERDASSPSKKTIFDAVLSKVSKSPSLQNWGHAESPSQPQPGSLAAALGMQVDPNRHAPPVRNERTPRRPTKTLLDAVVSKSAGIIVSSETMATSVQSRFQDHSQNYLSSTVIPLHRTNFEASSGSSTSSSIRGKKTLLGAIWSDRNSQSKNQLFNVQLGTVSQPTPGSLASVLGMQVDVARNAPPVRAAPLQ